MRRITYTQCLSFDRFSTKQAGTQFPNGGRTTAYCRCGCILVLICTEFHTKRFIVARASVSVVEDVSKSKVFLRILQWDIPTLYAHCTTPSVEQQTPENLKIAIRTVHAALQQRNRTESYLGGRIIICTTLCKPLDDRRANAKLLANEQELPVSSAYPSRPGAADPVNELSVRGATVSSSVLLPSIASPYHLPLVARLPCVLL